VRSLLRRLRKKLVEALHRLRAFRFRSVGSLQPAERRGTEPEDGRHLSVPPHPLRPGNGPASPAAKSAAPQNVEDASPQSHGEQPGSARDTVADGPAQRSTLVAGHFALERSTDAGLEAGTIGEEHTGREGNIPSEPQFPSATDEGARQAQLGAGPDEPRVRLSEELTEDEAVLPPAEGGDAAESCLRAPIDRVKSVSILSVDAGGPPTKANAEAEHELAARCSAVAPSADTMEANVPTARDSALRATVVNGLEQAEEPSPAIESAGTGPPAFPVSTGLDAATATPEHVAPKQPDSCQPVIPTVCESPAPIVGAENASPFTDALLQQPIAEGVALTDIARERIDGVQPVADDAKQLASTETARPVARDRPRAPRPPPEHYEHAFVDSGLLPPAADYALWNKAIVRRCLLEDTPEVEDAYLTITPRVLASAIGEIGGGVLTPEEAEHQLAAAVSRMYSTRVLAHSNKLQVLRRCGADGLPECAAFLALSVLAAYRMHTDEGAAANAYYKRLDELLRCGLVSGLPRGFEPDEFEGLWLFMGAWLKGEHNRQLAMPGPDVGVRRYVALPLTHVPLRQVDIERLPDVFGYAGYEPGGRVAIERLDADLTRWVRSGGSFTNAGMAALRDERRLAVLVQVAHELECWDGSHRDLQGRRVAPVEVFLHWERRIPVLSYLPRRPAVFPSVFDDGVHVLDAGQDGWYEPLPIGVDDGPELHSGFAWESASNGIRIVLQRTGAWAIAMAPSEFAGPISHAGLLLNASGAVLCREEVVTSAQPYLAGVTDQRCTPLRLRGMPDGWVLFTGVTPVRQQQPPNGLESLEVVTNVEIIAQGGLRLGRRWAWLSEAPPKILVAGSGPGEAATIDGEPVEPGQEGALADRGRLSEPGLHVVQVGRVRRRIEIVEPEVPVAALVHDVADDPRHVAALPWGSWALIGSRPGTIVFALSRHRGQGIVARCPFDPVWAISVGLGRGSIVRALSEKPLAPEGVRRLSAGRMLQCVRAWTDAIYYAGMRHPAIGPPWWSAHCPDARDVWAAYVRTAKEIKRRLKAVRR
jgi:hypothetical protein